MPTRADSEDVFTLILIAFLLLGQFVPRLASSTGQLPFPIANVNRAFPFGLPNQGSVSN